MSRYFFDIAAPGRVLYDFQGRDFSSLEEAKQMAELVALDFEASEGSDTFGSEVQIRDVHGAKVLSITIASQAKRAA